MQTPTFETHVLAIHGGAQRKLTGVYGEKILNGVDGKVNRDVISPEN